MLRGVELENTKRALACYLYEMNVVCEKCPYGYKYKNMTGDTPVWQCNEERLMKDALYLLDER